MLAEGVQLHPNGLMLQAGELDKIFSSLVVLLHMESIKLKIRILLLGHRCCLIQVPGSNAEVR